MLVGCWAEGPAVANFCSSWAAACGGFTTWNTSKNTTNECIGGNTNRMLSPWSRFRANKHSGRTDDKTFTRDWKPTGATDFRIPLRVTDKLNQTDHDFRKFGGSGAGFHILDAVVTPTG